MLCLYDTPKKSAMKITGFATLHFYSELATKTNTFVEKNTPCASALWSELSESTWESLSVFRPAYHNSYLVDPASSHMLVSKIKPCMSKYKQLYTVKLRTAHYISYYLFDGLFLLG
jgi:hypothetical protein